MTSQKKKFIALGVVLILILGGLLYSFLRPNSDKITATGMIEVTQADITSKISGFLVERNFNAGDQLTAGDIVARIDKTDYEIQYRGSIAAYQNSVALLRDLEVGARDTELTGAKAAMDSAQSSFEKAKTDFARYEQLYNGGAVSRETLDSARVNYTNAQGALSQTQSAYRQYQEGFRENTVIAKRYEAEKAKASMDASRATLSYTDVRSPINGRVLSKNYEVGEFIQAGAPIATVGDLSDCWVKIYVPSTSLGRITFGQEAQIRIDSFPGKIFKGRVTEIATQAEFTPRQTITKNERANLVFAVKVAVDNPDGIFKPGMPAEGTFP